MSVGSKTKHYSTRTPQPVAQSATRLSPIPDFDAYGNLYVGPSASAQNLHVASLEEMYIRFVDKFPNSSKRSKIWNGWMEHRQHFESFGLGYSTFVNGSFCSAIDEPNDVDLCYLIDGVGLEGLSRQEYLEITGLFDVSACKERYFSDPYCIIWHSLTDPRFHLTARTMAYWTRLFGEDRNGHAKSILHVLERGIFL